VCAAARAGEGTDAVVRELYGHHRQELVALATYRTGDPTLAEDLVQQVFIRLLERGRNGHPSTSLSYPFLHTCVMNAVRNHIRDEGNRTWLEEDHAGELLHLSATAPPPDQSIRLTELRATILEAAASLPDRQHQVFSLRLDGLSPKEIAVELRITRRNAREQLRRAKHAVARILEDTGGL